jgi:mannose-6-phosphate isomerase-like protein (cupin superfamily)
MVATQPDHWHYHPKSDETFLVIEGGLVIEFEHGEIQLAQGQMTTIPLDFVTVLVRWAGGPSI